MLPGLTPVGGHVADAAICAIGTVVLVLVGMTGDTLIRSALIYAISVTFRAGKVGMFALERETGVVMIEGGVWPTARIMT